MKCMHGFLWVALVTVGCATEGARETSSDSGEIGIFFPNAPDGVNCISFKLDNADGSTASFQFVTTASNVRVIRNLTIGAYELSAVAYAASVPRPINDDDCQAVPLVVPWTTQAPVPVVVQTNLRSNVDLTLLPAGLLGITVHWFEPPEVVAPGQGQVGALIANTLPFGTFVSWTVAAEDGPTGQVRALLDFPGSQPFIIIDGQSNPTILAIDPEFNTVYVSNLVTGTTDSEGLAIADGSIANDFGELVGGINPGDLGFTVANHTAYWVEMAPGAAIDAPVPSNINCFPCGQPLATNQSGANGLTAHANRVYWGTADGSLQGMNVTDTSPTTLTSIAPRHAYGATADDQFVYFIGVDARFSLSTSKIEKVPAFGGPAVTLVDGIPGGAFPIVAFRDFVYFLSFESMRRIRRVPINGGPVEDIVFGSIGGFAVTTDIEGHDVLYWSDLTHGGLIWRARL